MLRVLKTNLLAHITDAGRPGYKNYGVPEGGAMDRQSYLFVNTLLGNALDAVVIELYLYGYSFLCETNCRIAIGGADAVLFLNGVLRPTNAIMELKKGDVFGVGAVKKGVFSYLAIAGGFDAAKIMGSAHSLIPYLDNRLKRDQLIGSSTSDNNKHYLSHSKPLSIDPDLKIHAFRGPEWDELSLKDQKFILEVNYEILPNSDSMGFRLATEKPFKSMSKGIISSAVMAGTVQLLPSGQPLVLMRNAQTTGGYMRVLQLTESSINQLAQRRPGQRVEFSLV